MSAPIVAAFDLSSVTGVAHGPVGARPYTATWKLGSTGATRREKGAALVRNMLDLFKLGKPDLVVIEAPMDVTVAVGNGTNRDTVIMLFGLVVVCETICNMSGIWDVRLANVQQVRKHFTGKSRYQDSYDPVNRRKITSRENAKQATINACRLRGWDVRDDNAADAAAMWSYGGALLDKRIAALSAPLFAREAG